MLSELLKFSRRKLTMPLRLWNHVIFLKEIYDLMFYSAPIIFVSEEDTTEFSEIRN